jgi:hypothetical protein
LRSNFETASLAFVESLLRYRGRIIREADIRFIQEMIEAEPKISRRKLSQRICEAWGWVQANGALRDMVCRGLLLTLHRGGWVTLPASRWPGARGLIRRAPEKVSLDETPITGTLQELGALEFRQVRRTAEEPLFNSLMAQHHYLGHTQPVGEHVKLMVWAGGRPVACVAWSSAVRHLGPRDRFIGWSAEARRRNIRYIAYQSRYLILPWYRIPHLASHILGRMARRISGDWERVYGHGIYYLETFTDPERFRGTCYRAANWIPLGLTTGRGKASNSRRPNRPLKQVWAYPLEKHFRHLLAERA